jgi:2-oxoglutarate ferredoxin oxidoreductase subunit delta
MVETLPDTHDNKIKKNILINKKWCKGCGICVSLCPKNVLTTDNMGKAAVANLHLCTGCKICERHCPDFAITVEVEHHE